MMEPDAAPAGRLRKPASGRPRAAVRPYYEGPPFGGLDAARTKAGESLPDRGPSRAPSASGSYGPGDRNRRMARREAPAFSMRERG
jgi:hypothetical protein